MSNRRRSRRTPRSYAVRLQRRSLPEPPSRQREALRRWLGTPWLPAALAVAAEVGHLAAAFVEWPESAARGAYHILAGALLGLVAAAVSAASGRLALAAGAAVATAGPVVWLGGALLGTAPYRELPVGIAAGTALVEIALAAVLLLAWPARKE
jgi:hypothetical protein